MKPERGPGLVLVITSALVAMIGMGTAWLVQRGDAMAEADARERVSRAARIADHTLAHQFLALNSQLGQLGTLLREAAPGNAAHLARLLAEYSAQGGLPGNIMLLDGQAILASAQPPAAAAPSQAGRPHATAEGLSLAGLLSGQGQVSLLLSRDVEVPGHGNLLVLAELPTAILSADLEAQLSPPTLRIRLVDETGLLLAASSNLSHLLAQRMPSSGQLVGVETVAKRLPSQLGPGWVYAASHPNAFAGLRTIAALPEAEALGGWPRLRARVIGAAFGFGALVLALGVAIAVLIALRQSSARQREAARRLLEAAIEALPDGLVLWDAEDRLVTRNARHMQLYRLGKDAVSPGATFAEVAATAAALGQFVLPEGTEAGLRRLAQEHRDLTSFERELPDGRWVRVAQRRMPDGGTVGVHTEITEQKRAIAELAEARDAAAATMAAKSRLLTHVSHEMRTPLVSLLRLAEQLTAEPGLTATQRHRIGLVEAAGRHMLALANEVLDLAALEAGRFNLHIGVIDARAAFTEAAAMIQPVAEAKGVRVEARIEGLPPAMRADGTRLRQVALNLLGNAVKFSPEGGLVRLAVRGAGERMTIEVTDEGEGVPQAARERLFMEFNKLSPAQVDGAGLGLAITARLVAMMGGSIACLDREDGPGARFVAEMPMAAAEVPPPAPAAEAPARLRIMAVDDSPANLAVLRALLSTTGFEMEALTSGAASLEALQSAAREGRPFDVVLMDVMMPGMDGLETTRRIRALPGALGRVPVVAVTASVFPEDIDMTRAAGMNHHVSKPVDRARLLRAIAGAVAPPPDMDEAGELAAFRPALLEELRLRAAEMRAAAPGSEAQSMALHALIGTVGNLGEAKLVETAREALSALRRRPEEAPALVTRFAEELRAGFPELA